METQNGKHNDQTDVSKSFIAVKKTKGDGWQNIWYYVEEKHIYESRKLEPMCSQEIKNAKRMTETEINMFLETYGKQGFEAMNVC